MAETNKNVQVAVSGITPRYQGQNPNYGNWFLIDESGDFSLDQSVTASIWLVGGGCDGTEGVWNGNVLEDNRIVPDTGVGTSYSGRGGDGGCVFFIPNISIPKNQPLSAVIARENDKTGTSLTIDALLLRCDQSGSRTAAGGDSGSLPMAAEGQKYADQSEAELSRGGVDGVETPYGWVGSSGGGGAVCNGQVSATNGVTGGQGAGDGTSHRKPGTDAQNYGCGGGGGAICGQIAAGQKGGHGMRGCIIIAYTVPQKTLIVERRYIKKTTIKKSCDVNYASSQNNTRCCHGENTGCGCGNSSSQNGGVFPKGVVRANYTDKITVKAGQV